MCIACEAKLDPGKRDAFGDRFLSMMNNAITTLVISIGHRTGLFDRMADGKPRTSEELAGEAGLNERYVREWLGGMVAARIVDRSPNEGTHRLPPEHAHWLSSNSPIANLAVYAQFVPGLGAVEDKIVDCFRNGGGVPYSEYHRFHEVMAEDSGQTVVPVLLDTLIPLIPGMHGRLTGGIDVLDIGCGRGYAMMEMAKAYPNSRFRGYDFSQEAIAHARMKAREAGLSNITFMEKDLTDWCEPGSYDLITAFDAIHDQARPDKVLAAISKSLRPGGAFLMQDIGLSSEPTENAGHPLGAMLYGVSLMHCMTVSLAQGGLGLGTAWGVQLAEKMLREAGFDDIKMHRLEHDIQNAYFVMQT